MDAFELLVEAHRPAMKAVLAKLVRLLEAHHMRYVIGGATALSLYVRPRTTIDVDAFVDPAHKDELDRLLAVEFELVSVGRFHSKFKEADVEVDILYAGASAEDFALAHGRDAVILGTPLKAAAPEALLWLYVASEKPINFADAIELLRSQPALDVALVRRELERHQPELAEKLKKLQSTARQPVPSYDESRARRR
ncbi:MAG TPA: hypothetical protein VLI89_09680 [Burkholderiales bacterium]|nr:hypothetical protein [Burkholderiales bacterium]